MSVRNKIKAPNKIRQTGPMKSGDEDAILTEVMFRNA